MLGCRFYLYISILSDQKKLSRANQNSRDETLCINIVDEFAEFETNR